MWQHRSHVLAPLTVLTSKKIPWKWGTAEQRAFKEANRIISKNAMLAFPDLLKSLSSTPMPLSISLEESLLKMTSPWLSTVGNSRTPKRVILPGIGTSFHC
jgi:hypothetical protein